MSTEDEEKNKQVEDAKKPTSAASEDEGDEDADDEDDDEDEGESPEESPASDAPEDGEAPEEEPDVPRNRAERRAAAKREKRGVEAQKKPTTPKPRPKLPPLTVTGRSSADDVPPWLRSVGDWMSDRRGVFVAASLAVVVGVGGGVGWSSWRESQDAKAAALYADAMMIANSVIRPADAPPDPPSAPPRRGPAFTDSTARANGLLVACRKVTEGYPKSPVFSLARLCEATALFDLGKFDEARPIYQGLIGADVGGQEARVLEGLAFTLEAAGKLEESTSRFEELGRLQDSAYRDLAVFQQARLLARRDQNPRAKELLHGLLDRLNRTTAANAGAEGDTTGPSMLAEGESPSLLKEEARALLHDLDPADPLGVQHEDPQAMLRRLLEQRARQPGAGGSRPQLEE